MEAPSWYNILFLLPNHGTNPWKSQYFGILPRCGGTCLERDALWGISPGAAAPSPTAHRDSSVAGGAGSRVLAVGMMWSSTTHGMQAPSLMHLLIAVYTSGCNLEITLPESIKDLTGNIGISSS